MLGSGVLAWWGTGGGEGVVGWDLLHIDDTFGTLVSNCAVKKAANQK